MRRALPALLIAVATAVVYARVAGFGFVNLDDPVYVYENPHVLAGLSREGALWAATTTSQANWHPLTWLSLQLDASIGGGKPAPYHVTNVALHLGNALLLLALLVRMTGAPWRSALVAGLFALHPLHVESVAWVAERKDVLCAAFGLAAFHLWLTAIVRGSPWARAAAIAAYAASLMAKPMLVSLPLLLLLLDVWPLARAESLRVRVVEKLPFFALAAASCAVTLAVQSGGGATRSLVQYPLFTRAANAAVSCVAYVVSAVWPSGLAVYYPYPYGGIAAWKVAGSVAILAAVTAACLRARARAPQLAVGWLWYLAMLLPVIGLVQVGAQAMADRYAYLPLVGPFAALAFSIPGRPARAGRAAAIASTAAVVALAILAWRQVGTWKDSETLFAHALAVTADNAVAHNGLARALFERGAIAEAVAHCEEAVRIAPGMPDAESNLVRGLLALGRTAEAAERARDGLRLRPDDARSHVNAGLIARGEGRIDDAIASFRQALRLDPGDPEAHLNLGAALLATGRKEEALAEFREALALRPGDARAQRAVARLSGA
jgi:tetratricopeptide (TPR) repeat protein